jgi:hypothetical protein
MTRSILCGLLALVSVGALSVAPIACQSGGVGDPCTPEDEYNTQFPGFKVSEENIESRSFQCSTRICLVNHFQGRVSCPYGQDASQIVKACNGPDDKTTCASMGDKAACVESAALAPDCTCKKGDTAGCAAACGNVAGLTCDPDLSICTCTSDYSDPASKVNYYCSLADKNCKSTNCTRVLKSYVCHVPGTCQSYDLKDGKNYGKPCCVPGTETPVSVSVCGQCNADSRRDADSAVYCSCRCCPKCCADLTADEKAAGTPCADDNCGTKCDPNFHYCNCPTGFSCAEIRKNVGLGDPNLTGSYCIKDGSAFTNAGKCSEVAGVLPPGANCAGAPAAHVGGTGGGSGG